MPLTFGDARKYLAPYAERGGKSPQSEEVRLFTHEVLQHMLYSGHYGSYRTYTFTAQRGVLTLPYELEVPVKVKVGNRVGNVWNQWFDFSSDIVLEGEGCYDGATALKEDPNRYPTVYDLSIPAKVGIQTVCDEAEDAHIIIKGTSKGREVITYHKGKQIVGEYLSIKKGELRYTNAVFDTITEVNKTKTNGYVQLYAIYPESKNKQFLADYSPFEHYPSYRRFSLNIPCPDYARVTILGRIRLKSHYADNDLIPFDNIVALKTAGQSRNASNTNDLQTAQLKESMLEAVIAKENLYKTPNTGTPISVGGPTARPRMNLRRPWSRRRY